MAFSMPLKDHEKQPKIFMVFSWVFHGFAQNLRVFMAHENWKIKRFFMAFLMFFFMLFPGWHATKNLITFPMKIPLKSFENHVNLLSINSQDFHGFLVHSDSLSWLSWSKNSFLTCSSLWTRFDICLSSSSSKP